MISESIIEDLKKERARQELRHPEAPAILLHKSNDPAREQIKTSLAYIQAENDAFEKRSEHSWYGIFYEELKEIFSADTVDDLYKETVQAASVLIRLAELVKDGDVEI